MKPVSVLIVDDRYEDRYLLTRDLQRIGMGDSVFEAEDGQQALEFLTHFEENTAKLGDRFPPCLVFLDISMPRMGGLEFLEEFQKLRQTREGYSTVVVLMFSSSEHREEQHQALEKDFVCDFVVKGATTPEELREKVLRGLRHGRS